MFFNMQQQQLLSLLLCTAVAVAVAVTAATAATAAPVPLFSDSALFERLSHFKDVGVPGTVHDPLNQAAIADGSCRLVVQKPFEASRFWGSPSAVQEVISTLADGLPSTTQPSHFVLTARKSERLSEACLQSESRRHQVEDKNIGGDRRSGCRPDLNPTISMGYNVSVMKGSIHNWHRALCASEDSPDWNGVYDPAYQPQQVALTTGFVCTLACDCNNRLGNLTGARMAEFSEQPDAARDRLCHTFPYGSIHFLNATSAAQLAALSKPLVSFCGC